jgi:hypothetical protein
MAGWIAGVKFQAHIILLDLPGGSACRFNRTIGMAAVTQFVLELDRLNGIAVSIHSFNPFNKTVGIGRGSFKIPAGMRVVAVSAFYMPGLNDAPFFRFV